jgi:3-mercaptopyruvate sulfurtransferase SseA
LVLVALAVWATLSSQPRLPALQPTNLLQPPNPLNNEIGAHAAEIPRVSLTDAKTAYDKKTAFFIDVRDSGSYTNAHIPGAVNISLSTIENRLNEIPTDQWIITYCT